MRLHDLHSYYMLYGRAAGDTILREVAGYIRVKKTAWSFRVADAQFVSIIKNDDAEAFLRFPVGLIAEGVETEKQLEAVRQAGISEIQGFYYARPMPVNELQAFLESNSKGKA